MIDRVGPQDNFVPLCEGSATLVLQKTLVLLKTLVVQNPTEVKIFTEEFRFCKRAWLRI